MTDDLITTSFSFTPHPDIELGIPRKEIEAFVVRPREIDAQTPLVVTIPGYGETAGSEYFLGKLNAHVARKYRCPVLSVNFHGISRVPAAHHFRNPGELLAVLDLHYGWKSAQQGFDAVMEEFIQWATERGISRLPESFKQYLQFEYPEYHSFGLLPALDHFRAIAELAKGLEFDPRRIVLFGSSYGGFIANLMAKIAPNCFSLVVDNSGFSRVRIRELLSSEIVGAAIPRPLGSGPVKLNFPAAASFPWTLDELSPSYLSDSRLCIRNLLIAGHWLPSATRHCIFHSAGDNYIAPVEEKDRLVELLRNAGRSVDYHRIEQSQVDGRVFKTLQHGMDASLRSLFEIAVPDRIPALTSPTNQELRSLLSFPCGKEVYEFRFGPDHAIEAQVRAQPLQAVMRSQFGPSTAGAQSPQPPAKGPKA